MITVDVRGESEVKLALGSLQLRAGTARRLLRLAGQAVYRQHQLNMVRGVDPNGVPLPPVQRWTREISGYNPRSKVLHRTGSLRKSMGVLSVTSQQAVVGFSGEGNKRALAMTNGTPGRIKVSEKLLRRAGGLRPGKRARSKRGANIGRAKAGHEYVRIRTNDGRWFTKRVSGGTVSVRPQPRRFFYLGAPDIAEINAVARAFYAQLVAKANRGRT